MEQKGKLRLNDKQKEILGRMEAILKEAADANIGFVLDNAFCGFNSLLAYNDTDVSCFDAPHNAAYDEEAYVVPSDLHKVMTYVDLQAPEWESGVRVGLNRTDADWIDLYREWGKTDPKYLELLKEEYGLDA